MIVKVINNSEMCRSMVSCSSEDNISSSELRPEKLVRKEVEEEYIALCTREA